MKVSVDSHIDCEWDNHKIFTAFFSFLDTCILYLCGPALKYSREGSNQMKHLKISFKILLLDFQIIVKKYNFSYLCLPVGDFY